MRIDAHHHLWEFNTEEYGWIGEQEAVLKQDFDIEALAAVCNSNKINATVAVQARQSHEETDTLLALAEKSSHIKAVVGWVDLKSNKLDAILDQWDNNQYLKGFRHVLQDEPDNDFMLDPDFIAGLKNISNRGYCYDLLVLPQHLKNSFTLAQLLPDLNFVIDHLAKPSIKDGQGFTEWQRDISKLAELPNVYCKLSGMVTEANLNSWKLNDFSLYLSSVIHAFGCKRVMYGSDWPVCLLGGSYTQVISIVEQYVKQTCPAFEHDIMGLNAKRFYKI
jgi:L-fuconolactonase